MKPPPQPPKTLAHTHHRSRGEVRGLYLERAEYVSHDYNRRLVVEFDWHRAAAGKPPWRARRFLRRSHVTAPSGYVWRLAHREDWYRSLPLAQRDLCPWMESTR